MDVNEEDIGNLLGRLPPAPPGWVSAAVELPRARSALAAIDAELTGDPERAAETAALERALAEAGLEPAPELVRALRRRLDSG
jgi:hypothetical protein